MMNYTYYNGWKIPTSFRFKVEDESIQVNIKVETISITHQVSLGLFNYWRYHVHIKGTIKYNSTAEYIDNRQIMDFTRFW